MRLYFYLRPEGKEEQAMQVSVEGAIRAGPILKAEALCGSITVCFRSMEEVAMAGTRRAGGRSSWSVEGGVRSIRGPHHLGSWKSF